MEINHVVLKKSGQTVTLHPAIGVVTFSEKLWSSDREQAYDRALIVVRALADAGFLPDCEIKDGVPCLYEEHQ